MKKNTSTHVGHSLEAAMSQCPSGAMGIMAGDTPKTLQRINMFAETIKSLTERMDSVADKIFGECDPDECGPAETVPSNIVDALAVLGRRIESLSYVASRLEAL